MMKKTKVIWILDGEEKYISQYKDSLDIRYETFFLKNIEELENRLKNKSGRCDLLLANLNLKSEIFINFLSKYKEQKILKLPFLIFSSFVDLDVIRFCFNKGALDYLVIPFVKEELLAKIEKNISIHNQLSILQSEKQINDDSKRSKTDDCVFGYVESEIISSNAKKIQKNTLNDIKITCDFEKFIYVLSKKEYCILNAFLKSDTKTLTREQIIRIVWGEINVEPNTIDVHLSKLRKKVSDQGLCILSNNNGTWSLLTVA
ncbi:MAG: response regulator transcription factor [Oligoflexia bacterium]|nr:response regulator transcription factor [Oligoflexia bacterium]